MSKTIKLLMQGDSITDCGRFESPDGLGYGYAKKVSDTLTGYDCINKGISGNRAADLEKRWTEDCIDLKPDILSILIGINDTWRAFDSGDPTSAESFCQSYRRILSRVKNELPHAKIILMEPFVLPVPDDRKLWRVDLDPKIHCVRDLAREFRTAYIPLDGLLAARSVELGPAALCEDGVHPTDTGHTIITELLVKAVPSL